MLKLRTLGPLTVLAVVLGACGSDSGEGDGALSATDPGEQDSTGSESAESVPTGAEAVEDPPPTTSEPGETGDPAQMPSTEEPTGTGGAVPDSPEVGTVKGSSGAGGAGPGGTGGGAAEEPAAPVGAGQAGSGAGGEEAASGGTGEATAGAGQGGAGTGGREAPCTVTDAVPVQAVAAGDWHTCALTRAGTVRCWGDIDFDQGDLCAVSFGPGPTDALSGGSGWHVMFTVIGR